MEISKIINTKQLIETATLFEVTDNKPKRVAEVRTYKGKTSYNDYYSIIEIFERGETKYKKAADKGSYANTAHANAAKTLGIDVSSKDDYFHNNLTSSMILSRIGTNLGTINPFIHVTQ